MQTGTQLYKTSLRELSAAEITEIFDAAARLNAAGISRAELLKLRRDTGQHTPEQQQLLCSFMNSGFFQYLFEEKQNVAWLKSRIRNRLLSCSSLCSDKKTLNRAVATTINEFYLDKALIVYINFKPEAGFKAMVKYLSLTIESVCANYLNRHSRENREQPSTKLEQADFDNDTWQLHPLQTAQSEQVLEQEQLTEFQQQLQEIDQHDWEILQQIIAAHQLTAGSSSNRSKKSVKNGLNIRRLAAACKNLTEKQLRTALSRWQKNGFGQKLLENRALLNALFTER